MQVVVVEPGNLPSTRVVLTQLLDVLKREGHLDWRLSRERDRNVLTIQGADIIILFRCSELQTLIQGKLASLNGAMVIYATDDNLLEVPKETRDGTYFQNPLVRWIIRKLIRMANGMLVYSALSHSYFSKINKNTSLLEPLPAVYPDACRMKFDKGFSETVVGYAGTASHAADFKSVVPAIRELLETPNLRFEFIGYCPSELVGLNRVTVTPWISRYEDYLMELAQRHWDIGLAPLEDTLFNNCKTNLKFREYAAFGIAGVYSDIPLYRACVRDHENGLLVSNAVDAWSSGIRKLITNTELRNRLTAKAAEEARTRYTVEKSSRELMKLLERLCAEKSVASSAHLRRSLVFLYVLVRPFGIALAAFIQLTASIRHGTFFWKDSVRGVGRQ